MNANAFKLSDRLSSLFSGFVLIALGLIFLCSLTPGAGYLNQGERAIVGQLELMVVASDNTALALPKSAQKQWTGSDRGKGALLQGDSTLLTAANCSSPFRAASTTNAVCSLTYFTPLLRAPPTA